MSDRSLAIRIVFDALDRLSAPLRRMTQGTEGLSRAAANTARQLGDLKRTQAQIGTYRAAETRFKATAERLDEARKKTAALRAEMTAAADPPKKLAAAFARAERAEAALTERHEKQGSELQQLQRRLDQAGVEVADLANHERRLADAAQETSRALERQQQRLERIERVKAKAERIKSVGATVAGTGAIATAGVTLPIIAFFRSSADAAVESRKATAQARAAIVSMGPAAGRTLPQLQAFAGVLQDLSLYDDDDILVKVTANMLTFGKVTGRSFDRAQLAAVNLSTRLGNDLQASALLVGKALNDPVKGLTALRRVGIQFDDQQKAQIERFVASGKVAKAQGVILDELGRQFGGAAKAARDADPGGAQAVQWRNLQEAVGAIVVRYLPPLLAQLTELLTRFNNLDPATQTFIVALLGILAVAGPLLTIIGGLITLIGTVAAVLGVGFLAAGGIVIAVIAGIGLAALAIYNHWEPIKAFFAGVWTFIEARFQAGLAFWRSLPATFAAIGSALLQGLIIALNPLALVRHIMSLGGTIVAALKQVLGIKSPSRVFAGIGDQMMAGLSMGLDRGVDGPLERLRGGAARMTAALAGASIGITPVGAGAQGPGSALAARAPAPAPVTKNYHLQLPAGAGEDAVTFARKVMAEIKKIDAAEARSSYLDDE